MRRSSEKGELGTAAGLAGLAADPTPGDWATARSSVVKRARKAAKAGEELSEAVCGVKGLGMSTFLRSVDQAVATVCADVWYLDTDLGSQSAACLGSCRRGGGARRSPSTRCLWATARPRRTP
jgi:hypothetical protein